MDTVNIYLYRFRLHNLQYFLYSYLIYVVDLEYMFPVYERMNRLIGHLIGKSLP
jgi:hypothetical protein